MKEYIFGLLMGGLLMTFAWTLPGIVGRPPAELLECPTQYVIPQTKIDRDWLRNNYDEEVKTCWRLYPDDDLQRRRCVMAAQGCYALGTKVAKWEWESVCTY